MLLQLAAAGLTRHRSGMGVRAGRYSKKKGQRGELREPGLPGEAGDRPAKLENLPGSLASLGHASEHAQTRR